MPPLGKDLPFSAPPPPPPPPFKLSGTVTFLIPFEPYPVAGTRAVMAQRSLNMASSTPKTLGPSILAASSPNINLSTNMASEAISEHAPRPPQRVRAYARTIIGAPPIVSTFRRLCAAPYVCPTCARPTTLFWLRHCSPLTPIH